MIQKIFLLLLLCSNIIAMENNLDIPSNNIVINKNTLLDYLKNIDPFIELKKNEKNQLAQLPDGNSFFGRATNFFIEKIFAPLFSKYGDVNIEEAKIFLGRSFEREDLLKKAFETLPDNETTISYLQDIFSQAQGDILNKKDGARFLEIVRKVKYKKLENPKCMGEKDQQGNYKISDADFYNFSAATLTAFYIFEEHVTIAPTFRRHRRNHIQIKA